MSNGPGEQGQGQGRGQQPSVEVRNSRMSVYDRYGRLATGPASPVSYTYTKKQQLEARTELGREIKWIKMTKDWDKWVAKSEGRLKTRVRKGVPDSLRAKAWVLFMGIENVERPEEIYLGFKDLKTDYNQVIHADVERTYSDYLFFRDSKTAGKSLLKEPLNHVLRAYANQDAEVGYCQGMSFHAGLFLMYVPENQCFWMLCTLLRDPKYNLHGLFAPKFPLLNKYFFILESLIESFCPKLKAKFTACCITPHAYAMDWFMTIFQSVLPMKLVLRIMDVLLYEGVSILFSMGVYLLKKNEAHLLSCDTGRLFTALKQFGQDAALHDADAAVFGALSLGITSDMVHVLGVAFDTDGVKAKVPSLKTLRKKKVDGLSSRGLTSNS